MNRMTTRPEYPAERRARHRDTVVSAIVAALVVIGAVLLLGVRGLGVFVTALLAGGTSIAVLAARRAGWDWGLALRILLFYAAATALLWAAARALGSR